MHDWLSHRARVTPNREALVVADTGNRWDYRTLDETVEEMAGRLAAYGVGAGDHVGCVLESGAEQVCLVHAAMRLGATLVPLDPSFTVPELEERVDRADVSLVVCDDPTEQTVVEVDADEDRGLSVLTIGDPQWTGVTSLASLEPSEFTIHSWERGDVQLLLFTSGTTGDPKVVQLTMGNLLSSAVASGFRLGVDPADRWLVPLSLHHMGGIAPMLRSTLYGTTTIVRTAFEPGRTVDDIQSYDATAVSLVPTMLRRMLSSRGTLPDCLRFVLVGGAPCPVELVERCRNFSVPICPTYGMTETASQVATARHRQAYETPATVGRPLLWTDVTVVDDDGDPLPTGESGELVVSGPTVSPGYYGDDDATAAATGEYGFHTGDVGYFDTNGQLFVLNRLDDRIVSGGENVDPGEVCDALLEHPGVDEAAVVGIADDRWGERVGALVVPDGEPPLVGDLESFLRERLAGYKLPRTVGFAEELPRTVSGTVERAAVREQLLEGATDAIEFAESGDDETSAEKAEAGDERPSGEESEASEEVDSGGEPGSTEAATASDDAETGTDSEPTDEAMPGEDAEGARNGGGASGANEVREAEASDAAETDSGTSRSPVSEDEADADSHSQTLSVGDASVSDEVTRGTDSRAVVGEAVADAEAETLDEEADNGIPREEADDGTAGDSPATENAGNAPARDNTGDERAREPVTDDGAGEVSTADIVTDGENVDDESLDDESVNHESVDDANRDHENVDDGEAEPSTSRTVEDSSSNEH